MRRGFTGTTTAPAVQIGSATNAVAIGAVAGSGTNFGLIVDGGIGGSGVYAGITATGLSIGGLGGSVSIANGIAVNGTVQAQANGASATAIRIGNQASWKLAEAACDESGGRFAAVSDDQILDAQRQLAARDGVFVEPASAAGIAGLLQDLASGESYAGLTVVVTVTGHGLKDTATALEGFGEVVDTVVDADLGATARAAGLG